MAVTPDFSVFQRHLMCTQSPSYGQSCVWHGDVCAVVHCSAAAVDTVLSTPVRVFVPPSHEALHTDQEPQAENAHALHPMAPAALNVPVAQALHEEAPASCAYRPAAHDKQALSASALPAGPYLPAAQLTHGPKPGALRYVPSTHATHVPWAVADVPLLAEPAAHDAQSLQGSATDVGPAWNVP